MQSLDDYLLTNIWPVILVRHLLGTFILLPTNTYNIVCGILQLGMKDFWMEMCTQYLAYTYILSGLPKTRRGTQKFKKFETKSNSSFLSRNSDYLHTYFISS